MLKLEGIKKETMKNIEKAMKDIEGKAVDDLNEEEWKSLVWLHDLMELNERFGK